MSTSLAWMARKRVYDWQDKARFFAAVATGVTKERALAPLGASRDCGYRWWRDSAGMEFNALGAGVAGPPFADGGWVVG